MLIWTMRPTPACAPARERRRLRSEIGRTAAGVKRPCADRAAAGSPGLRRCARQPLPRVRAVQDEKLATARTPRPAPAGPSPARVFALVLLVVFSVEGAIMLLLPRLPAAWRSALPESLLDAAALTAVTAPALWWL